MMTIRCLLFLVASLGAGKHFAAATRQLRTTGSLPTPQDNHEIATKDPTTAATTTNVMKVVNLPPDLLAKHGAYCLDGSPFKYFFRPAQDLTQHSNDYVLYFQGGGWCYTAEECHARTQSYLGSSKYYPDHIPHPPTLLRPELDANPLFANMNHIFIPYCDGGSFTGNQNGPVPFSSNGTEDNDGFSLWFRGKHNLASVLEHSGLTRQAHARVLVTGCSSGGLTTYLHADPIRLQLPATAVVKALPDSGFFLWYPNVQGRSVYEQGMQQVFALQNATAGVNQACIEALPVSQQYKCLSAEYTIRYTTLTPLFLYQSILDTWNVDCVLTAQTNKCDATVPEWQACVEDASRCTTDQIGQLLQMANYLLQRVVQSGMLERPGFGAFLHSCQSHCSLEEHGKKVMANLTVQGTPFGQALERWWNDDGERVAEETASPSLASNHSQQQPKPKNPHVYWPCRVRRQAPFQQCNPTCEVTFNPHRE